MKWFRVFSAERTPTPAIFGTDKATVGCGGDTAARGRRLLAALQPARDGLGRASAAGFDVTDLPGELLADLFVVRAEESDFAPVTAGVNAEAPLDRLAELPNAGPGVLTRCTASGQPVALPGLGAGDGLLVPLYTEGRVSHVLGLLPAGGEHPTDPLDAGFRTANLPLADLPTHAEILTYWDRKRAGRRMPARANIDPLEIPHLLRHVMLLDVLGPQLDFRYRLLGDEILLRARPGLKGQRFGEIEGKGPGSSVWEAARRVVATGLPRYGRTGYGGPDRFTAAVHDLLLPLSDDGVDVNQLLILAQFRRR